MRRHFGLLLAVLSLVRISLAAQTSNSSLPSVSVPPVIQFSNVASDESGTPLSGTIPITFSLYNNSQGGAALWTETQNVALDSSGHYSVYLGVTQTNGIPMTLFTGGEAHWLGVKIAGQAEQQPRIFLVSVPYALKAGDAATVGGLPPSAFVLAAAPNANPASATSDASNGSTSPSTSSDVTTSGGTVNFLPLWDTATDITSSVISQSGSGSTAKIGINNSTPAATLDVKGTAELRGMTTILGTLQLPATGAATAAKAANSEPQTLAASAFNSSSNKAVNQTFQWQAEPAPGTNDTSNPSGTLNLLFGEGVTPSETGLSIAGNGQITFAPGQTVSTTGTVTGAEVSSGDMVSSTNGFTLQGTLFDSGSASAFNAFLGFAGPPTSGAENTATGYQAFYNGQGSDNTASGFEALANSNGASNTGLGYQALVGATGNDNTAVGAAAMNGNKGGFNTALGASTLQGASTGDYNTAVGMQSMNSSVTSGYNNTAVGAFSAQSYDGSQLASNIGNNTFLGQSAGFANGPSLTNATAVGANAEVAASNSLVLGSVYGVGASTNNTAVGIGTTTPGATLDVEAPSGSPAPTVNFGNSTNNATFNLTGAANITGSLTLNGMPIGGGGGGGTITGVTAGTGLTGGGTSGNVTLSVNPNVVAELGAASSSFSGLVNAGGGTVTGSTDGYYLGGSAFAFGAPFNSSNNTGGNAFLGFAGNSTTTAPWNTATGYQALSSETNGAGNTASGYQALLNNTGGNDNTAVGYLALLHNTTGFSNTASGVDSLESNTTGQSNTASGIQALAGNTTGSSNTAVGTTALPSNVSGGSNIGVGETAGASYDSSNLTLVNGYNTFIGARAGFKNGTKLTNATAIGAHAGVTLPNTMVLGSVNGQNSATANVMVGIGTTAPGATLDVEAPSVSPGPTINFGSASNPATFTVNGTAMFTGNVSFPSTQSFTDLTIAASTNPTLTLGTSTTAGTFTMYGNDTVNGNLIATNVGIGTATPVAPLDVEVNSAAPATPQVLWLKNDAALSTQTPGNSVDIRFTPDGGGNVQHPNAYIRAQEDGNSNWGTSIQFGTVPDGNPNGAVEAMRIASNGFVGIGTTTPGSLMDVEGGVPPFGGSTYALNVAGASASSGSGDNGVFGIRATGGNGDTTNPLSLGGDGVDASAGLGGLRGGTGVSGTGGDGNLDTSEGGTGVYGAGGGGSAVDGVGGFFLGGALSTAGDGVKADAGSGYAGNFQGDLNVSGQIFATVKDFKIDHPLDPANKYLVHASVESSEMMNIYTGNVTTDVNGEATVHLPEWFEALNTDFRYQLTVIGQFAVAIIAQEIQNHQFLIRTNQSHVKVSWQVTAVRQDAYAKAHPLVVEEEKDARLKGFYIHPELYGAPEEKQIEWARHPQMMQRMKEHRNAHPAVKTASSAGLRAAAAPSAAR